MLEIVPPPEQAALLSCFSNAGGVVDFLLFACTETTEDVEAEATHREAIVASMSALQSRHGAYTKITSLKPRIVKESVWRVQIDSSKVSSLVGKRISASQFLGERYHQDRGGLVVPGSGPLGDRADMGFAYAFSDPPYPIRLSARELGELFEEIKVTMLGGITDGSVIYQWPTDWSTYFDAGREWWGSFLWSLARPATNSIAVIAASTTD